ncbi:hypothetical protein KY285_030558 [Solanum tuberosum]|nr:hypothetical protein KY285_030558 [Solanum tuberosum]
MEVQMDTEQLLSFKLTDIDDGHEIHVTIVYASTDRLTRIVLWDDLYTIATTMTSPWLVAGDFNEIIDDLEKYGDCQYNSMKLKTLFTVSILAS